MTSPQIPSLLEGITDPTMRHAIVVHLPVVLAIVAWVATLAAALLWKRQAVRWTAVGIVVLLLLAALTAVSTGEDADHAISVQLSDGGYALLERHETMAKRTWIFVAVTGALVIAGAVGAPGFRRATTWLGLAAATVTMGWLTYTAHYGGTMVYRFGIGTPDTVVASASGDGGAAGEPAAVADQRLVHFERNVRPVLEETCFRCHNAERSRGGLDQTTIAGLLTGGKSGPAVVPGQPEQSLLVTAIRQEDDLVMPPNDDPLDAATIEHVVRWIRDGAVWSAPPVAAGAAGEPEDS